MRPASIAYPSVQEYCDALQNPKKCFRTPELQQSAPDLDARGLPMPRTGGAAAVFKLENGATATALKVFKFGILQREQRYRAISDHLRTFNSRYLVEFAYDDEGIRVPRGAENFGQATWFPTLRMTWVSGLTLNRWIDQRVQARAARALADLAGHVEEMVGELKARGMAHGDLQHGNVLVVGDEPVLVDYDGTFVPALAQEPTEEYGLTAFQHPLRQQQRWWHPDLDDFSAWVIWLTLRAVAASPALWQRCDAEDPAALLFMPEDFQAPHQSDLWPELRRSPDREVVDRAERLLESLRHPYEVPRFGVTDPLSRLRQLCAATPRDHDAIDREAKSLKPGVTLPAALLEAVEVARQVVALRALCAASPKDHDAIVRAAGELERAGIALPPDLQNETAAARLVARLRALCGASPRNHQAVVHAADDLLRRRIGLPADLRREADASRRVLDERDAALAALEEALAGGDGKAFAALWQRHGAMLAGAPAVMRYEFHAALAAPASEQAVIDAWERLGPAGQKSITDAKARERVGLARERLDLLKKVAALPNAPSEDSDRALVAAYRPDVLDDCPEAATFRLRFQVVGKRVAALDRVEALLAQGRGTMTPEEHFEQVRDAALPLPPTYSHARKKDVEQTAEWLKVRDELAAAVAAKQWTKVAALARHAVFARLPLPAAFADVAQRAVEASDVRRQLEEALSSNSLEKIAAAFGQPDLLDGPDCADLADRAKLAMELIEPLRELTALAADPGDGRRLVRLWQDHVARLAGWAEGPSLAAAADLWRERLRLLDDVGRLLNQPRAEAQALVRAWKALDQAGGHPDAQVWQKQAAEAEARAARLEALRRVGGKPGEQTDAAFAAAWGDDDLLEGWWEAEAFLPRLRVVRDRLAQVDSLKQALDRGDDSLVERIAEQIPAAYRLEEPTPERVAQARRRAGMLRQIREAAQQKRWREVADLGALPVLTGVARPDEVEAAVVAAKERLKARAEWEEALLSRSCERGAALGGLDLLDDWPEVASQARQARQLVARWRQLQAAAQQGDGRALVELWSAHGQELSGWAESSAVGREADAWKARLDSLAEIERLARAEGTTARQFVAAWQRLLDSGHPDERKWADLADLMRRRAACLDALRAVPDEPGEVTDRHFQSAWSDGDLVGWWEADALRPRLSAVAGRLRLLADLSDAVRRGDVQEMARLITRLPSGYALGDDLRRGVGDVGERSRLRENLLHALAERPLSDVKIAVAHDAFAAAGLSLNDPTQRERVELARRRRDALMALAGLPAMAADRQDEVWVTQWQAGDLDSCADVTPAQRERARLAAERSRLAREAVAAVAAADVVAVQPLADHPLLQGYPPVEAVRARIVELLREGEVVKAALAALRAVRDGSLSDEAFAKLELNLTCVAAHRRTFTEYREELGELLRRELLRARPRWVGPLLLTGEGASRKVQARWECPWRTFGLGGWLCKLAISGEAIPADPSAAGAGEIDPSGYVARSGRHPVPPRAARVYVTVWPVLRVAALDLTVVGAPLAAGPVAAPPERGGWRRLFDRIVPKG